MSHNDVIDNIREKTRLIIDYTKLKEMMNTSEKKTSMMLDTITEIFNKTPDELNHGAPETF